MSPAQTSADEKSAQNFIDITPLSGADAARLAELLRDAEKMTRSGQLEEAEELVIQALDMERSPAVLVAAGRVIMEMEGPQAALPVFGEALQKDALYPPAHMAAADAFFQLSDGRCIVHMAQAVALSPETRDYRENFLICANIFSDHALSSRDPVIVTAVNACLERPDTDLQALRYLWLPLLIADPKYNAFYKTFTTDKPNAAPSLIHRLVTARIGGARAYTLFDTAHFARQTDLAPLATSFFLNGLRQLQISDAVFEAFLTALRKRLLEGCGTNAAQSAQYLALAGALAVYCHETEYIFETSAEETSALNALRSHIEQAQDPGASAYEIAVYACYAPLHEMKNADALLESLLLHPHLGGIVDADIALQKQLRIKKDTLASMSGFDNDVSIRVREQYENFPYPRWKHAPLFLPEAADAPLRQGSARLLIAGCGTGREAAGAALSFPQAQIDAIDLSASSLSYALVKAEEQGLGNIRFRHGDILHLDFPDGHFDAIFSHGVLHHMQDPLAGWKSLLRCLKPDGLMRIALYSETARRHLAAAQRLIAEKKFPATAEGMKDFRRQAATLLPYDAYQSLIGRKDFYKLSTLRDLLFHEQEHRITLPQLGEIMDSLGLELVAFGVNRRLRTAYQKMFSGAPDTLENWHRFEQANPDTFSGMYQFWCRRKNNGPTA